MEFCDYCGEPIDLRDKNVRDKGIFHASKQCADKFEEED